MTGYIPAIIFGSVIAAALIFLLLRHAAVMRRIADYTAILQNINSGNVNRRFRCRASIPGLIKFTRAANAYTEQLQRVSSEKLHLEQTQKTMISNISHDLRTPLTSILGYLQVLQTDGALTGREKSEYLSIILKKSENLYSLLESFFELSKLEADTKTVTPTRLNINEELENALSALYREFDAKRIVPVIDLPNSPLLAWGDRGYLQRILDNLLMNAIRHGENAKEIGISARRADGKIFILVWDTGDGIDEKDMPFIFDRLYMSDESRRRNYGGSGLGLAIARRLVESLGGEITAHSEAGVKTVFTFSLYDAS